MSSERKTVQGPLMKYAEEIGWQYLKPEEALRQRQGDTGRFLRDTLEAQLLRLNPGVLDAQRTEEVMRRLSQLRTTIEGNREALVWLHGEQSVYVPEERRERNVRLIDFEHLDNNVFHVTDEWRQKDASGVFANRADVVFLINGLPVAIAGRRRPPCRKGCLKGSSKYAAITRKHRNSSPFPRSSR